MHVVRERYNNPLELHGTPDKGLFGKEGLQAIKQIESAHIVIETLNKDEERRGIYYPKQSNVPHKRRLISED